MSQISASRGKYGRRFGIGIGIVVALVALASANLYTNLAPELSAGQQQALQSGLATVFLVLVVGLAFVSAIVGRESLAALRSVSEQARRLESGEFDAELPTNRDDELGDISRSLSAMRDVIANERDGRNERLRRYSEMIEALAEGESTEPLDESAPEPELAELAASINRLADRMERRNER
jgi:methyl-accepting chemotaxis protein